MTVETNGAISPEDAVAYAAALAQHHFGYFVSFGQVPMMATEAAGSEGGDTERLRSTLGRLIDDVGLSVRSINSLKNSNIRTLGDLVRNTEEQLLKVRNVGDKAVNEIAELLLREGLNFGMQWEESESGLTITDRGSVPVVRPMVAEAGKEA
jgi:DNA-directed RNA polymerase subunit alpha